MGDDIVRIGAGPSIQYARRGFSAVPIYRVTDTGRVEPFGDLIPVDPDGFVMVRAGVAQS